MQPNRGKISGRTTKGSNALLNMDEKGAEDCLEEQEEADTSLSGKEDARTSIMEKLAQFKEQSSQMGIGNNKNREKAASL